LVLSYTGATTIGETGAVGEFAVHRFAFDGVAKANGG
jgi:hypothetical protein